MKSPYHTNYTWLNYWPPVNYLLTNVDIGYMDVVSVTEILENSELFYYLKLVLLATLILNICE